MSDVLEILFYVAVAGLFVYLCFLGVFEVIRFLFNLGRKTARFNPWRLRESVAESLDAPEIAPPVARSSMAGRRR